MSQGNEPIISEDAIRQLLAEQKETIRQRVVEALVSESLLQVGSVLRHEVGEVVRHLFAAELKDEIRTRIINHKEEILASVDVLAVRVGTEVAAALVEGVAENMRHPWNRKKVVEAVFG